MAPGKGDEWKMEMDLLRARLDNLEKFHRKALDDIRSKLSELETRGFSEEDFIEEIEREVVIPVPVPEQVTAIAENEAIAMPPPLPPEQAAAKVVSPAPAAAVPVPAGRPAEGGFEMQLGRVWLVRFGIVLLLTGLVLLGNFAYRNWIREMPNGVRLFGLFLCAGALIETGRRLAAKPALQKFGEVILAGGMSFFYYCTFASHHVPRLRVVDSPVLAGILLLGAAGMIAVVSWLRNARTTAVLGILLASYSTMLQPIGWMSCVSSVVLAAAGAALMLRPGWVGPGTASMVGTYGAFFGWQLMGASGGEARDPAVMWFLPPVWVMLALPTVLDKFRETMSDRARAWFTGGNNVAFFTLFSWLWFDRFGGKDYWMVCCVFGLLLVALGILGRHRSDKVGGVNLFQGLALASLSMVIRLEGFHLLLGLGLESLVLACAFMRFRRRTELVFSSLAAVGALLLSLAWLLKASHGGAALPLWSMGFGSLLVAASAVPLRVGAEGMKGREIHLLMARGAATLAFAIGAFMGLVGWAWHLPAPWHVPAMGGVALALSAALLLVPRGWKLPEVGFGAIAFLLVSLQPAIELEQWWPSVVGSLFALAAAWLWHRQERRADDEQRAALSHPIHGWAYSMGSAALIGLAIMRQPLGEQGWLIWSGCAGLVLMAVAIFGKVHRLASLAGLLSLPAMGLAAMNGLAVPETLWAIGFSLAMLALLVFCGRESMPPAHRIGSQWVVRSIAFIGTILFWIAFSPGFMGDGLAVTSIVLLVLAMKLKLRKVPEIWGFLGLSVLWLLDTFHSRWALGGGDSWRGWAVVAALAGLVVWTGHFRKEGGRGAAAVAGWAAVAVGSLWATQMLVWRHDWHAVSVLWTVLGFAVVTAGLGLRLAALRQAGFCLLTLAVGKVFVRDVWDFNAFTRVVAFIVLGAALILLGLFYNRFAPVLKRLLEEEKEEGGGAA